jgi:hypothetical protein
MHPSPCGRGDGKFQEPKSSGISGNWTPVDTGVLAAKGNIAHSGQVDGTEAHFPLVHIFQGGSLRWRGLASA